MVCARELAAQELQADGEIVLRLQRRMAMRSGSLTPKDAVRRTEWWGKHFSVGGLTYNNCPCCGGLTYKTNCLVAAA